MKQSLLPILRCPESGTCLSLKSFESVKINVGTNTDSEHYEEIIEGILASESGINYPIIGGIPRLLPKTLLYEVLSKYYPDFLQKYSDHFQIETNIKNNKKIKYGTLHMFSYQWTTFINNYDYFKDLFLSFVSPYLSPSDFKNKRVLELGCGSGRPASIACSFGAEVIALDLSQAVESAYEISKHYPNLHIIQGDIYAIPFEPCFDFVYSVGVIQHLPDPGRALKCIAKIMQNNSRIVIWVYGIREKWYMPIIILRNITIKLPHLVLHSLSFILAIISEIVLLIPYRILSKIKITRNIAEKIPGKIYAKLPFRENVLGWFDRLGAPITYYFSKDDVHKMLTDAGLTNIDITHRPGASASWVAQAYKIK